MNTTAPVRFSVEADGIGWLVFDDPNARANVFNPATQAAFAAALDHMAQSSAKAVVVISAKDRIFLAGADLGWLGSFHDAESAANFSRVGQQLFARLADASVPVVCAIDGACAGGGYELALACDWRIASDGPATRIGLPETSLGTIPGWGGCVRLPRLIGPAAALEHILAGQLVAAAEALRCGLIDEVVPSADLRERARTVAGQLAATRPAQATSRPTWPHAAELRWKTVPVPLTADYYSGKRKAILTKTHGRQPALLAAIDVAEKCASLPIDAGFEVEALAFGDVTAGAVCKNMLHAFAVRDAAKKRTLAGWFPSLAIKPRPIVRVGVVGAGVMGAGIAQLVATRGFPVVVREIDEPTLMKGLDAIRRLFDDAVQRKAMARADADLALARVSSTTAWDGFAECDLVIEAIVENVAAKQKLFSELATVVRPDTVLASNTSALPIEDLAGHVSGVGRTLGIHFFNPVGRMSLVELVIGARTSAEAAERALGFIKAIGKMPVICRSSPGFLATRVLFFYLNEAVKLWEAGETTRSIDDALRAYGWPMGPLRLIDEVGLDVTAFIFGEMARYFPGRFVPSTACERLLESGLKGRKSGAGFYRHEPGAEFVNDLATGSLVRPRTDEENTGEWERVAITDQLMSVMTAEAKRCLDEGVVKSPDDVDFALLNGAGFPVFRGGLFRGALSHITPAFNRALSIST